MGIYDHSSRFCLRFQSFCLVQHDDKPGSMIDGENNPLDTEPETNYISQFKDEITIIATPGLTEQKTSDLAEDGIIR